MSTTVDSRVVEMRFDNKQFESNVQTSMSTIDKLKQKLNLSGAAKGLDNLDKASKNVDMNGTKPLNPYAAIPFAIACIACSRTPNSINLPFLFSG